MNVYILDTGLDTTHVDFTQSDSRTTSNVVDYWNCWNCGGRHYARDCPGKRGEDTTMR